MFIPARDLLVMSLIAIVISTLPAAAQSCGVAGVFGLTSDESIMNTFLGEAVEVTERHAFVGMPYSRVDEVRCGRVQWFTSLDLAPEAEEGPFDLVGDPALNEHFGRAIAADGDWLAVGAPNHGVSGAVYLFKWNGIDWDQVRIIEPQEAFEDSEFGLRLDLVGDLLVIRAHHYIDFDESEPMLEVYRRNGAETDFLYETTLVVDQTLDRGGLGQSISLGPNRILSGSDNYRPEGETLGAVHEFVHDGDWTYRGVIRPPAENPAVNGYFGADIALDGAWLAVGSDRPQHEPGHVVLFEFNGTRWAYHATVEAWDPDESWDFGAHVALDGDQLFVGDPRNMEKDNWAGAVYGFQRIDDTWWPTRKLLPSGDAYRAYFGRALAADASFLVAGAPEWDYPDSRGLAQGFATNTSDCNQNGACDELDIMLGTSVDEDRDGTPDECEPDSDGDGRINDLDNCQLTFNPDQADHDADGIGDACETCRRQPIHAAVADPDGGISVGSYAALTPELVVFTGDLSGTLQPEAIHVYRRDADGMPSFETLLETPDPDDPRYFGRGVVASGPSVFATHHWYGGSSFKGGAIYHFEYDARTLSWSDGVRIEPPDPGYIGEFGSSIAISGDRLAVGHPGAGDGAVHLYERDATGKWTPGAVINAPPGFPLDELGNAVALDGDILVVATDVADGAICIHRFVDGQGWQHEATISGAPAQNHFGRAVAVSNGVVAVASETTYGTNEGNVQLFAYDDVGRQWSEITRLAVPPVHELPSLAFANDVLLTAAPETSDEYGVVYAWVDTPDGWTVIDTLTAPDGWPFPDYGDVIVTSGHEYFIGGFRTTTPDAPHGFFVLADLDDQPDCNDDGTCDVRAIALGLAGDCDGDQLPDDCEVDADFDGIPDDCDDCVPDLNPKCLADLTHDGIVGLDDLIAVLSAWNACAGDIDGSGTTEFGDLVIVISHWGPC